MTYVTQTILTLLVFLVMSNTYVNATILEVKSSCDLIKKWRDKGSGAKMDGRFSLPTIEPGYVTIGGFGVQRSKYRPTDCVAIVKDTQDKTEDGNAVFVKPDQWELIWTDKGTGAKKSGSMWRAVSSDDNYRCLGSIPQKGYSEPNVPSYRCVHKTLTKAVVSSSLIWNDEKSGAHEKVSMFRLPNTQSFVAVTGRLDQIEAFDLDTSSAKGSTPIASSEPKSKKSGGFLKGIG